MQDETWKDIDGYEGFYQVSNSGNVRSVGRYYWQMSAHGTLMEKYYEGKPIKPFNNGNGYLMVMLMKPGEKRKTRYIHRLVAEAFIPNPDGLEQVNHKDYNKQNNSVDNLEWITRIDNVHYSIHNMMKPKPNAKQTTTGERYITKKGNMYRLNIQRRNLYIDKLYGTLEEAIKAREVTIGGEKHYAG